MKNISVTLLLSFILFAMTQAQTGDSQPSAWIRINQLGYLPDALKTAVFISLEPAGISSYELVNAETGKTVFKGKAIRENGSVWGMQSAARLDFSSWVKEGRYFLRSGKCQSPVFSIAPDVYDGIASFILKYMRQQRCGFNPFLEDTCHQHDGFIVDHPTRSGEIIDVRGGWHDASDYLQYTTTSANAVYHLLYAWSSHPEVYPDEYMASGLPGKNNIPDIIDEAVWGMEWLLRMNPAYGEMYNQIADDRDHAGMRLPVRDKTSYGNGIYRPVYFVTGKSQGLSKHKNRSTGVSSVSGKFASAFALGSRVLEKFYPEMAKQLKQKAIDAYNFGLTDLGVTQTACFVSPYFYEEDNWTDDMELAAAELYLMTGDQKYLAEARVFGQTEPVTPWMSTNKARHYQFYPFLNLGHAHLAAQKDSSIRAQFSGYLRDGLEAIRDRAAEDPFRMGIPFIWCSNNLVSAALMQAGLYQEITGDNTYSETEAAMRDWLFGCNPWGTSMICGLPEDGDSPVLPHSAYIMFLQKNTLGGLIDGPVYSSIYSGLIGIHLMKEDTYKPFQNGRAVYHDDIGDYSTNEPTMDGTASLSWYFSWLENKGNLQKSK